MPRTRRPKSDPHFTWQEGDVTLILPHTPTTTLSEEQHTILWALERVSNKASLSEAMMNVAHYLADHPTDKLVPEAVRRAEQRVEHAT